LDVDPNSLQKAQETLSGLTCQVDLIRDNFANLRQVLQDKGVGKVDFILADLGFCSAQLNDPKRGLSLQDNMPLDMRLDSRLKITAADLINQTNQARLADLIYRYGEEKASRRIARCIDEYRRANPIKTTGQLAAIVCRALNRPMTGYQGKIHPATRTFQALRIAVNDELGVLERLLTAVPDVLKSGGVIAVISFHSLEDRIVKNDFRDKKKSGLYEVLTKKPLIPEADEVGRNPRARSAKCRMAKRC
jgi:16S rRNA (cytosine1402-N4)-methyltransferase